MRGISGAPTTACISGETGRGFMMPRGSRFPAAGLEEGEDTARTVAARAAARRDGRASLDEEEVGREEAAAPASDADSRARMEDSEPRETAMAEWWGSEETAAEQRERVR